MGRRLSRGECRRLRGAWSSTVRSGFQDGRDFLRATVGTFDEDGDTLVRALDVLTISRASWKAELQRFAEWRGEAKGMGRRTMSRWEPNPNRYQPWPVWYGAARPAALFSLAR